MYETVYLIRARKLSCYTEYKAFGPSLILLISLILNVIKQFSILLFSSLLFQTKWDRNSLGLILSDKCPWDCNRRSVSVKYGENAPFDNFSLNWQCFQHSIPYMLRHKTGLNCSFCKNYHFFTPLITGNFKNN